LQKILQKFNINGNKKSLSILLAPHFNIKATMSPTTVEEHDYMSHVLFASIVGSFVYAMVCTRLDLLQAVLMVSRYMYDPGRGH